MPFKLAKKIDLLGILKIIANPKILKKESITCNMKFIKTS
jgi:hypothetical protein